MGGGTYLGWGVPTFDRGYLSEMGGTYLGWGVATLDRGYLPWMGDTYLGWGGSYPGWEVSIMDTGSDTLGYPTPLSGWMGVPPSWETER